MLFCRKEDIRQNNHWHKEEGRCLRSIEFEWLHYLANDSVIYDCLASNSIGDIAMCIHDGMRVESPMATNAYRRRVVEC
jgi:hypothetical protein